MNCEDYKQAIAADPSFDGGAAHLSECASCQAYRKELLALDDRISAALSLSVPSLVMPELPELDTQDVVALKPRQRNTTTWLAVAATVLVAATLGFRLWSSDVHYDSLEDEILAHLDHEPASLVVTDKAVSDAQLSKVVPASMSTMGHSAGLVTYARTCEINGKTVPHLVIQGERGPVTILLMPDEKIAEAIDLSGDHVDGVLLPVGNGSIAIIGERGERIDAISHTIENSVMWTT
jgi:hypothetical protein